MKPVFSESSLLNQEIIPGFAAHRSGQFEIHDILLSVDQEPVDGWHLDSIKTSENAGCNGDFYGV